MPTFLIEVTWTTHLPARAGSCGWGAEILAAADRVLRATVTARRVLVDGEPGVLAWARIGSPSA